MKKVKKVKKSKPAGSRRPNEPELFGLKEVAAELNVRHSNVRTVAGLPDPYDHIAASTLWRADEVRVFAAKRTARLALERAKVPGAEAA